MSFDRLAVQLQSVSAVAQSFVVLLQLHVAQSSVGVVRRHRGTVGLTENKTLSVEMQHFDHTVTVCWYTGSLRWLCCSRRRPPGTCGSGRGGSPAPSAPEPTPTRSSPDSRTFCPPGSLRRRQLPPRSASLSWRSDPTGRTETDSKKRSETQVLTLDPLWAWCCWDAGWTLGQVTVVSSFQPNHRNDQ